MRVQSLRATGGNGRLVLHDTVGGERASLSSKTFDLDDGETVQTIKRWVAQHGWSHLLLSEDHVVLARGFGKREAESWDDLVREASLVGYDLRDAPKPRTTR
jgi:hypothetical protein